jgi:N-acetylglucosamine-6-phosphate deacetylase
MIHTDRGRGSGRILLSGGDLVLPDQVLSPGTLVLQDGRIAEIAPGSRPGGREPGHVDCTGLFVLPGFIDVHVHGIEGTDTLDGAQALAEIAARLPRYGVTAFCPTSIACAPSTLKIMLASVRALRGSGSGARVLPAHLESNFINPDYRGAQPLECLRIPAGPPREGTFSGAEILDEIRAAQSDVGIMTVAPEIDGAIPLIQELVSRGIWVSLGHSGASYDEARQGIEAGARQATHLFNRMTPLGHRAPGLAAAVLESDDVTAEIICDGVHVHPAMVKLALSIKGPSKVMTITDGTAGSGLSRGARTSIGGHPITVGDAAYLDDGTIAGSVLTMDRSFAKLVTEMNMSLQDAARTSATTPAQALDLQETGAIVEGFLADLVLLDRDLRPTATYIAGELVWPRQ